MTLNIARLMTCAYLNAKDSPDPSNQNGAVVVHPDFPMDIFGSGHNGFGNIPWDEETLANREKKLALIEHAERAALFNAAQRNPTRGLVMVCPWACCTDCGRAIGRMGVSKLIVHTNRMKTTPERWIQSVEDGLNACRCDGCEIEYYDGPLELPEGFTIKANGADWNPVTGENA